MRRGEIFWVKFPGQKRRPAVIVSPEFLNVVRDRVLAAPCTSQRTEDVTHTELLLNRRALSKATKVQCQDIGVVLKTYIGARIRQLTSEEINALDRAVALAAGIDR